MNKIPKVENKQFEGMKMGVLKKYVKAFYINNFKTKTIRNKNKEIDIKFSSVGIKHLLHARKSGYIKLKAVTVLDEMIENAIFLNFKNPDSNDTTGIIGYMNFEVFVSIEGQNHYFKVVTRLTKDGNFYYDHSVKVIK